MEDISGYLFSKKDRTGICISLLLIAVGFFTICVWRMLDPSFLQGVFIECLLVLFFVSLCLVVIHFRHKKFLFAKYFLSSESIVLKIGNGEIQFSNRDTFRISIVSLFHSEGKGYSYIPYIAIWDRKAPIANIHPFKILESKDILLLPYTDQIYKYVLLWANISAIPEYPQISYSDK